MPEPSSIEEFEHFHRDGLKNLEIEKAKLGAEGNILNLPPLDSELTATLDEVFRKLSEAGQINPDRVFKEAIVSLEKLDAKRFLIENLLEAMKRGEKLKDTLDRYKNLGLMQEGASPNVTDMSTVGVGKALTSRKSIWRRATTAVVQIAVNAFKSIPKWVEIEPQITLIGPIPVLSFTLKGKGMSIQELFETLRGSE